MHRHWTSATKHIPIFSSQSTMESYLCIKFLLQNQTNSMYLALYEPSNNATCYITVHTLQFEEVLSICTEDTKQGFVQVLTARPALKFNSLSPLCGMNLPEKDQNTSVSTRTIFLTDNFISLYF
jgi:hypothetical protein